MKENETPLLWKGIVTRQEGVTVWEKTWVDALRARKKQGILERGADGDYSK